VLLLCCFVTPELRTFATFNNNCSTTTDDDALAGWEFGRCNEIYNGILLLCMWSCVHKLALSLLRSVAAAAAALQAWSS
jgi:hypothetical protein